MPKSTNRLRVAFLVDDGLDRPDGVQQYVINLGETLREKGHYVRYLAGSTKRKDLSGIIPLSKNLRVRFNGNVLTTPLPASKRKIKEILDHEKFDVIHVQMPYSPLLAGRVTKLAGEKTRIIGTFHVLPLGGLQAFGTRLLGLFLRRNLKNFDKFLSVSKPAQAFAKHAFNINSEVLPNPVDIGRFSSPRGKTGSSSFKIVFLGRLVPRKGCLQLVYALDKLIKRPQVPSFSLDICGDGNQRKKIENFIGSSPLKDVSTLHGFVSEEDKVRFLSRADLAIFPSISGESFGIVLLEAMAAGSGVVLAGNNPGYASVLGDIDDCMFDPNRPDQLADKIERLISDETARSRIHEKQQKLVKMFDVNKVADRLVRIYRTGL